MAPTAFASLYRSTIWQATVLGICCFLAPGIWGAMNSLGAGGLQKPYLVNAGNALTFCLMVVSCFFGSSLVNLIGIKYALVFGTLGYAPFAAGLYCNNRFGTEWFVLFGAACCGVCAGIFWMAEGAIILSYPEKDKRGKYIAYWLAYRVGGQILGGAINLGLNAKRSEAGAVGYNTYLAFIALQCIGPLVALLLSPPHKVQRTDGTPVIMQIPLTFKQEMKEMLRLVSRKEVLLITPLIFQSTFSEAFNGTFLALHFTVRARALGSFLSAFTAIIANFGLGFIFDLKSLAKHRKARYLFIFVYTLQIGWWIWSTIIQHEYARTNPTLDWSSPGFGRGFTLYVFLVTGFNMMYDYAYWLIGEIVHDTDITRIASYLRGVESAGQAISYGINATHWTLQGSNAINFALTAIAIGPAWLVVRRIGLEDEDMKGQGRSEVNSIDERGLEDKKAVTGDGGRSRDSLAV